MLALSPPHFKLHVRWLLLLTPVTYLSKLLRTRAIAVCLQLELSRVSMPLFVHVSHASKIRHLLTTVKQSVSWVVVCYSRNSCSLRSLRSR
ncbi:hypothetical protein DEH81_15660 [Pectobacterium zantedeschiae]|nr:hypothetical protein DEH81_15660 [Pectobacterium zantedeschiae]